MGKKTAYQIVMESRKEIVDELICMMREGKLFWEQEWFISRPFNPVSGTIYKGGNSLRLMWSASKINSTDPRWMTMKNIQKMNWRLKKGSKGVLCEKWKKIERAKRLKDANGNFVKDSTGKYITDPDETEVSFIVNYFTVFNASCVDGIESLNTKCTNVEGEYLLNNSPFEIAYGSDVPEYRTSDNKIHLPINFTCEDAKYYNFYRELIKGVSKKINSRSYPPAMESLISELGAVYLAADTSVKVWKRNSAAHLQDWCEMLLDDYNSFFKAAQEAEYAVGWISDITGLEEAG